MPRGADCLHMVQLTLFSRKTWVSRYQKGKTSMDMRQEMMGFSFSDGSGISWTICKQSAPRSRQITTPTPHHSILQAGRSSWRSTDSVKALTVVVQQGVGQYCKLKTGTSQVNDRATQTANRRSIGSKVSVKTPTPRSQKVSSLQRN